ncbi:uncharacterized protein BO88DRAFT_429225 [Aspergillus vadensis CBS 113365]|uniref:Uncharacterized protein n=1 Tax=Aspergillus vadensis (strain CBS 113365 / IMI 142717 / IBT 24658) TaxID=1448311 RepID=A0A319BFW8_ASPVC|nr:hypothetical protein BO88DRAFT_429225 [Aspergillus vadensis CBS 113365]PYH64783.1 hypothetical protein BO88DRAFT_429225 [Aspergillus vadensis CBS 113365]
MYQMPGWASPKHTRSFILTGGLMTMERSPPECFMAGIGEGMNDRGVPCGKETEGNDLLLLLDDHVQDRCTLIGPTSGTKHRLYHGTQYDVHRTRFSSRHTYRSYLGGRLPSHIKTLLLILFAHVHLEYEDEHGTASLPLGRSSRASRRDTSASERLQASTLNYGVGLVQCDGECGEPYDPASGKTIELRLECFLIARKKPPAEISLSTLVRTAGGMMIMDDRYQTTSPPGSEGMADIHGYCKGLLAAYDMQAREFIIHPVTYSGGVNYPAGNTFPFDLDASLLSPKRDKSSHVGDLRDCAKASASPAALTRIDWTRKEASRKGFQGATPNHEGATHLYNPEQRNRRQTVLTNPMGGVAELSHGLQTSQLIVSSLPAMAPFQAVIGGAIAQLGSPARFGFRSVTGTPSL